MGVIKGDTRSLDYGLYLDPHVSKNNVILQKNAIASLILGSPCLQKCEILQQNCNSIVMRIPRDPSMQIIPTLGPKNGEYYLHLAIWILREVL